jgi:hypothetical protein
MMVWACAENAERQNSQEGMGHQDEWKKTERKTKKEMGRRDKRKPNI